MANELPGFKAIGIVRNKIKQPPGAGYAWKDIVSDIVIDSSLTEALNNLDEFSHIIVLYCFNQLPSDGQVAIKVHPRGKPELPLVGLFAMFIWRGYWISWNAPDSFGQYLAFGVTTILSLHIILNLFVVTGLLPTKGLPLPFISYGGTNLLSTLFMTGILLNISRQIIPYRVPPGQE